MEYNTCKTCGADGGRCGMTIDKECWNCAWTRKTGEVHIDSFLPRTDEELKRTMAILSDTENKPIRYGALLNREVEKILMRVGIGVGGIYNDKNKKYRRLAYTACKPYDEMAEKIVGKVKKLTERKGIKNAKVYWHMAYDSAFGMEYTKLCIRIPL